MTEPNTTAETAAEVTHAGGLLRAARQQQGLHIAALAASIKVAPAKLEALEAGRYDELPDATFARALANTVCRVLKIDPGPVLAQLPGAADTGLARVDSGLNTPFRDRPGRTDPAEWTPWRRPVLWLVGLLLLAAAAFVLVPTAPRPPSPTPDAGQVPLMPPAATPAATPADDAASGAVAEAASAAVVPPPAASAAAAPVADAKASATPTAAGAGDKLVLHALKDTWVRVIDGGGQTLMSRVLPAGETVELTAVAPLSLRIGNVQGTELKFRGRPVDLAAATRDNIANLTLP